MKYVEILIWVMTIMGIIFVIYGYKIYREENGPFLLLFGLCFAITGLTNIALFWHANEANEANEKMQMVKESPEEYSFYLDGEDVEYDKIDLDQYKITYDLESKKVFLTRK